MVAPKPWKESHLPAWPDQGLRAGLRAPFAHCSVAGTVGYVLSILKDGAGVCRMGVGEGHVPWGAPMGDSSEGGGPGRFHFFFLNSSPRLSQETSFCAFKGTEEEWSNSGFLSKALSVFPKFGGSLSC